MPGDAAADGASLIGPTKSKSFLFLFFKKKYFLA
jgi:hypothetical protein